MNYWKRAEQYAKAVTRKKKPIPVCKYVRQACRRFLKDLKRKDLIQYNPKKPSLADNGNRWCKFLEKLPHVKGKWAAKNETFVMSDWQIFCTVNMFGWHKKNGRRRFREVYIEVPRKNGKSYWIAGIGIGMLVIDGEFGAEVYCGATTEKQAWEIFLPAKQICERTPMLCTRFGIEINAKSLTVLSEGGRFQPVIGNPGDGASPSCGIADEYHEQKTSDLVDTFQTGMGARENPLQINITTAGTDTGGPCYDKRDDVIKILNGSVVDDSIFGIIYTIDEEDDWATIQAQKKANPNYGISVDAEFLKGQLAQAKRSATKQAAYKTRHLNQWVGAKAAWMNMLAYQVCRKKNLQLKRYRGRRCYVALDLSSKKDFAVMAILFPPENGGKWAAFCKHYLPEDVINDGGGNRYKAWHADGWITSTHGNGIDFDYIADDLIDIRSNYEIISVPYDPFQATWFSIKMLAEGFPMVEVGQTVKNLSEPMKELDVLILQKKILFQADPVLMWMFGNVTAKLDAKDNIFPRKERFENKIDGPVAIMMAMNRAVVNQELKSVYEERGIRTI